MAAQVFADEELERLRGFPEIGRDELLRFFTLTPADIAFVDPGRGRGPADRLGLAVALCTLSWLGFVPDKVSTAPPVVVARLADQLGVDPVELRSYGRRAKTRTEHLRLVAQYLGWHPPSTLELKELDEFLLARAITAAARAGRRLVAGVGRPGPGASDDRCIRPGAGRVPGGVRAGGRRPGVGEPAQATLLPVIEIDRRPT
ncbi:DUF4158 domain-containing protein [Streptosporangium roseum]|uniref:DUF4158 domain-containing protein n=1 Tax=Streptosporangium roseum TaxID=2001 RepID=UPI0033303954